MNIRRFIYLFTLSLQILCAVSILFELPFFTFIFMLAVAALYEGSIYGFQGLLVAASFVVLPIISAFFVLYTVRKRLTYRHVGGAFFVYIVVLIFMVTAGSEYYYPYLGIYSVMILCTLFSIKNRLSKTA